MRYLIKQTRHSLNGLLVVLATKTYQTSWELNNGYKDLKVGVMRLGKLLGELGDANPYPESMDPGSKKIEPAADMPDHPFVIPDYDEFVFAIKFIRQYIDNDVQKLTEAFNKYYSHEQHGIPHRALIVIEALQDAKMWYGEVLGKIREAEIESQKASELNKEYALKLAKEAYTRYGSVTEFKNFQGNPMPDFEALPETIQKAWVASIDPMLHNTTGRSYEPRFYGMLS